MSSGEGNTSGKGTGPWRSRDGPLYAALVLAWVLLSALAVAVVLHDDQERVEAEFLAHAEHEVLAIRDRLRSNEAVLDGFSAFLGSIEAPSHAQLSAFAEHVLQRHPHIYMIEVVERVASEERSAFERALALRTGDNGRISRFDYAAGRSWGPVPQKPDYFPVSFIWPESEQSMPILGLDIDSVPHLRAVLRGADRSGAASSSEPFELVEGPRAFVMIRPARLLAEPMVGDTPRHRRFAMLVVKTSSLRPDTLESHTDHQVFAVLPDGRPAEPLFDAPATDPVGRLERLLLPQLDFVAPDYSTSRTVQLRMHRQMRWTDASVHALAAIALVSAGAFWFLMLYVRQHHLKALQTEAEHALARFGALHDPLTGLANRNLLRDRLRLALAQWHRHRNACAVFFIDLDRFKEINDRHGHEAGDAVLREVAARLAGGVRESDTVARVAGDEFVVLVSGTAERAALAALADKLRAEIAKPMCLPDGAEVVVTASLGIGVCPDDGDQVDALLNGADRAMYLYKQHF